MCTHRPCLFHVSKHTQAHCFSFLSIMTFVFGWRPCRLLTLVALTLVVGELLSKLCWRGVKSNPICSGKNLPRAQKLNVSAKPNYKCTLNHLCCTYYEFSFLTWARPTVWKHLQHVRVLLIHVLWNMGFLGGLRRLTGLCRSLWVSAASD